MKKSILLLCAIGFAFATQAQTGYYLLNGPVKGNPKGLNTDAEFTNTAGWTSLVSGQNASPTWSANQTLPFSFKFNDAAVTSYKVSTTGVLTFDVGSSVACPAEANTAIPSAAIPNSSIMMWGVNMKNPSNIASRIATKTFGTAPNRHFYIQLGFLQEAALGDGWVCASFVLEESTNVIYIVEQRTVCLSGSNLCSSPGVTTLTVGVQVDGTTAVSTPGSPNHKNVYSYDSDPKDNTYFIFRPGSQPANEAGILSIEVATYLLTAAKPYDITMKVVNNGTVAITSMDVTYTIDGGAPVSGTITGLNIAPGAIATVTHPTKFNPTTDGAYAVNCTINKVNTVDDSYIPDNSLTKSINVVDGFVPRKVLHESFSSSTCGPCNPGNVNVKNILDPKTAYTIVKYQQNYPSTGDPYTTSEAQTRHSYYGISGIPFLSVDGGFNSNSNSYTSALFDAAAEKPSFLTITGTSTMVWKQKVTADITLTPMANNSSSNLKLHVAIIEKTTLKNVKTNGEKEFHNIVKKMMPDASGTAIAPLVKGTPVSKSLTYTFNGAYRLPPSGQSSIINLATEHSVENFANMAVVAWVQDNVTKEVFQSETFEMTFSGVSDVEKSLIKAGPVPADKSVTLQFAGTSFNGNGTVVVKNVLGQDVISTKYVGDQLVLNTQNLTTGLYTVSITCGAKTVTKQIMVQH